ncbi:hypothetical protein [Desulfurobacterium atlanticum]|uniref:Uncharacterized protein n=1 Tax=Desulfurobacterium atlanticum TaxID=240169 RepID=A0A238XNC8_9BACT|nr:hypothetical protein [Desulfurobacterium atlanticum]SNR60088.1 hypothetical protein SAMN06265340_101107 [Desulfurobacterium atlanticum]
MDFLIVGPLNGHDKRLKGLVEVTSPDITIAFGPMNLSRPLTLKRTWFYIHGKEKDFEILSKSDGVDFMSRIFKYKNIYFCGLSGIFHPQTYKFTRKEWAKRNKGKFPKKDMGYIFNEDILALFATFEKLKIPKVNIFVSMLSPENKLLKEIVETINPDYCIYPSKRFQKFKEGTTKYIGIEDAQSFNGKYIIHF